jgi:hypothetical protein
MNMVRLACRPQRVRAAVLVTAMIAALIGGVAAPSSGLNLPQNAIVSPDPVDWTPNVMDGRVEAFAQVGQWMVVGGQFTTVRNANTSSDIPRANIFAYNATTGKVDPAFIPAIDGEIVALASAGDGASVFVGGYFNTVNGVKTKGLVKLDVNNGQTVPTFSAKTNSNVRALVVRGNRLFVSGAFTTIKGVARTMIAAVDVLTGAVDPNLNISITGTHHGSGATTVLAMDVTPDASRMVIIGNFNTVGGLSRVQAAMIDLTTQPATVANWQTNDYSGTCSSSFPTYMRGLDISPDGSYVVIVTTGSGYYPSTLCDSAERWEMGAVGSNLHPTWIDFTGGDTMYSTAITGSTVYVAGHQRWENDQAVGDRAVAGAVARPGIAALDPISGVPYKWNPTKTRGVGTFALVSTPLGLLEGSDTTELGGEYHARMGMFPLAGGEVPVAEAAPTLPGNLYLAPSTGCLQQDTSILYRINAGGSALNSNDCGSGWLADSSSSSQYRNTGSSTASYGQVGSVNGSVPPGTPVQIFSTERYDPSSQPEMSWHFPVTAGTHVEVRLYFANQYSGTSHVGDRIFNVAIDGTPALQNFDIVADAGNEVGEMKAFLRTSDGSVDIDFTHVKENPLINGIEIVNKDVPPPPPPSVNQLGLYSGFDGSSVPALSTLSTPSIDWSKARGTFSIAGTNTVYAGSSDGKLYAYPFDGSTFGSPVDVIGAAGYVQGYWISFSNATGFFYDSGRLYYTRSGDARLYYRWFSAESNIIGSVEYTASGSGDGLNWSGVRGMTESSGHIFYGTSDGNLHRIDFAGGVPLPGTDQVISGPGTDGRNWSSNGLFVADPPQPPDSTPPTTPGQPAASSPSAGVVNLTWAASTDPDNPSLTYRVYRDGGATAIGQVVSNSGTTVSYTDAGLAQGSVHTYTVDAFDGTNASPQSPASDPVTVSSYLFKDDFSNGFAAWTNVTGLTLDSSSFGAAPPSALGSANGTAAYAYHDLPVSSGTLCAKAAVNVTSVTSSSVTLLRFRTSGGVSVGRAYITSARLLYIRADVQGTAFSTGLTLPAGWNSLEICAVTSVSGSWTLYLGGSLIGSWTANNGTTDIGRIQIGETAAVTATMAFDDVVLDTAHIG